MKKIIVVLMAVVITICATIGVSAESNVGNAYQIDNVTVIFDTDSQLSNEQQEVIANLLVNPEYGVVQANLICNIFGHKNTQEGVTTITHKVLAESPRCLQELFTITICSRCNESTVERNAAYYISCCPEE
ncbi:MAG: hypothetical protein IJB94_04085 [Clostridia bacterium]|nr:hypothetical protein [Clostridia bacterium]